MCWTTLLFQLAYVDAGSVLERLYAFLFKPSQYGELVANCHAIID